MPELPEVETICRGLRPRLTGRKLESVQILERRLRIAVDARLAPAIEGRRITGVGRRAKFILLFLDSNTTWIFHLGMSGKLVHVDPATPRQKHDHIIATLDSGYQLRYHDPRRFGLSVLAASDAIAELPQLARLGPDPFDPRFDGAYLYNACRKSERRVRDLLLDQRVIAGIGNIYANEILCRAGVRPATRSRRLSRDQVERIARQTIEVLREAIRWCGTSVSDYRDADDRRGEFQDHLRVYDREGETCRFCPSRIKRVSLGNRSAYYCPACQR